MKIQKGPFNRYLYVDLSEQTFKIYDISDEDRKNYIGAKGLALKIYNDLLGERLAEVDPLGNDNLLIFAMGVLLASGSSCSARFEVLTRSPLTGLMVGSSCGGPFGEACKTAGWDGVIISGKADKPAVLRIDENGAAFEDAGELWGLDTHEVQNRLELTPREGAAVIGPAGENLVSYANICSGHRFAGRGGVGAVMGSKNLKAVVARGKSYRIEPVMDERFRKARERASKYILRNSMTKAYRAYGTNANVRYGIKSGFSPVHNFRDRYDRRAENTSGEAMDERYTTTHSPCRYCSVLCGHKGTYPDGKVRQIPEYETIGMFGSNIDNYDPDLIGRWNEEMNLLGMDTISAGGTIAWAMEAGEKGIRSTSLEFGKTDNISAVIKDIAYRKGEGAELAEGCRVLSRRYGGEEFAIHVKGLECAAYDPRASWGHGLSYAVYNKGGCHLGSYLVSLEVLMGYMPALTTLGKAHWVVFLENIFASVNSLQTCLFSVFGLITEPPIPKYLPIPVLKVATIAAPQMAQALMDWSVMSDLFWGMTGIKMSKWDFLKCGERITRMERAMDVKLGLSGEDDSLPDRFTKEKDTAYPGKNTVVPIEPMVRKYYKIRKYNENGAPRELTAGTVLS